MTEKIIKPKNIKKHMAIIMLILFVMGIGALLIINFYVKAYSDERIISADEASRLEDVDCILVLGCGVRNDGTPSNMLTDRLNKGVEIYKLNAAPKLLMSGDHGSEDYDEVNVMKQYAITNKVPSEDVFMDHAGFSTYESIYRALEIFQADKIIIVSQEYHLYRALYIAQKLNIEAYGVAADNYVYYNKALNEIREIFARNKDFIGCIFKPKPSYLGEAIPVNGNGDVTNDKEFIY